ncbi:cytochrome b561 family protein [marine gamma proteobacterium HTCC2143]|jgi:cytochrome b|uniref:Cytochrome b561 family protein n=1 Tax=marine gamma proteobacterium HTCC2143 TaxID=247633 RepID=A0YGT0_9GAMM|nr:cytochrome b561 family protein [marine gamma proteobacterium HTCC2143]
MKNVSILVWDRHTRIFHWLLVLSFSFSLTTGLLGDIDLMDWHMISGYSILGLLIFRSLTGVFGKDYGRFSRFSLSPKSVIAYLKGDDNFVGHNPLGSWMVIVMLVALLLQALSGLMTSDDIFVEGPWVMWVSDDWVSWAGQLHGVMFRVLIALVALHLMAILFYRVVKKQPLVVAMITGSKLSRNGNEAATNISISRLLVLVAIAITVSWLLVAI